MSTTERYSRLEPFPIETKVRLAIQACTFFAPLNYHQMCKENGLEPASSIRPLSVFDFINHLSKNLKFENALKYQYRIKQLLDSLQLSGILTAMGQSNFVMAPQNYYFFKEYTEIEKKSALWLAPALGPGFLKFVYEGITTHITGVTADGDEHAGTGILIDKAHILTCAHVVNDMKLNEVQIIQGNLRKVLEIKSHPTIDVGLITLEAGPGDPIAAIAFRNPDIAERVHTLGYPRIPLSREPALIMQSGEVVSEPVTTIHGDEIFLYSAIARPGNSGGPIIAESGHIVGIVSQDLSSKDSQDAPFYAGVPTALIQQALNDIGSDIKLPIETYE